MAQPAETPTPRHVSADSARITYATTLQSCARGRGGGGFRCRVSRLVGYGVQMHAQSGTAARQPTRWPVVRQAPRVRASQTRRWTRNPHLCCWRLGKGWRSPCPFHRPRDSDVLSVSGLVRRVRAAFARSNRTQRASTRRRQTPRQSAICSHSRRWHGQDRPQSVPFTISSPRRQNARISVTPR